MTEPEQQIAIAEWCNEKPRRDRGKYSARDVWWCPHCNCDVFPQEVTFDERHDERALGCGLQVEPKLRDYLHDLNAMHEAEEFLASKYPNLCWAYSDKLRWRINSCGVIGDFRLFHATAAQRAEALLCTIGKWKD